MFSQNHAQFMQDLHLDVYKWIVKGDIESANAAFINVPTLDVGCMILRAAKDNKFTNDKSFMKLFAGATGTLRGSLLTHFKIFGHMFRTFDFGINYLDASRIEHVYASIDSGHDFETAYDAMLEKFHAPTFVYTTRRR